MSHYALIIVLWGFFQPTEDAPCAACIQGWPLWEQTRSWDVGETKKKKKKHCKNKMLAACCQIQSLLEKLLSLIHL